MSKIEYFSNKNTVDNQLWKYLTNYFQIIPINGSSFSGLGGQTGQEHSQCKVPTSEYPVPHLHITLYASFLQHIFTWLLAMVTGRGAYYIYIYCEFNMNAKARDTWGIGEVIESFVIYREDKGKGQSSRALKNGCKCVGRFSAGRSTRSFFLHFQRDFPSRRHTRFLS